MFSISIAHGLNCFETAGCVDESSGLVDRSFEMLAFALESLPLGKNLFEQLVLVACPCLNLALLTACAS